MLKLSVWMLDDMLRLRPIGGRVNADLVVLICGEQLGAVQWIEIGCDREQRGKRNHSHPKPTMTCLTSSQLCQMNFQWQQQNVGGVFLRVLLTWVDSFVMWQLMEEALLVFDVSQVPKFHCVVNRGRRQQPITAQVELCVGHFGFVQLVFENLWKSKQSHQQLKCLR